VRLPIVEVGPGASCAVHEAFQRIIPGSITVAIERQAHMMLYYEGGIYSRPKDRAPTQAERREYALIAAGRAKDHAPTVAVLAIHRDRAIGLKTVGFVDTDGWIVRFFEKDGSLSA